MGDPNSNADRRTRGKKLFREVTQLDDAVEPSDAFLEFTIDEVFGDVWSRPGLTRKERRLISITAAATSSMPDETSFHLLGALKSGDLTPDELIEVILQIAHYSGWPKAASAYRALLGHCATLGLSVTPTK